MYVAKVKNHIKSMTRLHFIVLKIYEGVSFKETERVKSAVRTYEDRNSLGELLLFNSTFVPCL